MSQTLSITEARDNFPALVRQISDTDEAVVVTNRSQPRVIMLRWETYQQQRIYQEKGAKQQLQELVSQMEQIVAVLQEVYQPTSSALLTGQDDLKQLAGEVWTTCTLLDKPRRLLASTIADGFLNLSNQQIYLTLEQLKKLGEVLPLLHEAELTMDMVARAARDLAEVDFDSIIPFGDGLAELYFPVVEDGHE